MVDAGSRSGAAWSISSIGVGITALMLAFVPYYVGVVAAVAGLAGLVAGIIGLLRRADDSPALSSIGMAFSTFAIVAGIVMTFVHATPASVAEATPAKQQATDRSDTATVLNHELTVSLGTYRPGFGDNASGQLAVTLTSRLDKSRTFSVIVAAFDGAEQLAADTALVTLNARESQQQNMFAISGPQFHSGRLKGATFKVISASSTPAK